MDVRSVEQRWLMLVFSLSAKRSSERVEIWRKLRRIGALSLSTSGHLLPLTAQNQERFEWIASSIRCYKGKASVIQVHSIDDLPSEELVCRFAAQRSKDYASVVADLKKLSRKRDPQQLARVRRRFEEIAAIDFFDSPMRSRVEGLLARAEPIKALPRAASRPKRKFHNCTWITRFRPGIDRVSSAWLITRFIDPAAKFAFSSNPEDVPGAVPFDMFQSGGFGHRGEDCTFETLRTDFAISDPAVRTIAEIVHDADLADGKFGRNEGLGLDLTLIGWAHQGVPDDELLRRGTQLIEGLYESLKNR